MKKVFFIFLCCLLVLSSCNYSQDIPETGSETGTLYEYTFINNSSYSITVTDYSGDDYESFTIAIGNQYVLEIDDISIGVFIYTNSDKVDYNLSGRTITFTDDLYWDYDSYLTTTKYQTLLSNLSIKTNITKTVIDEELDNLKVRQDYEASYYSSGDYIAYTMLWKSYNSHTYSWNYYIDVDIWTDSSGTLRESMCSYYDGGD